MKQGVSFRRSICMSLVFLLSILLHATSYGYVQLLEASIPPFQLNASRYILQLVIVLAYLGIRRHEFQVPRSHWLMLSLTSFVSAGFNILVFTAAAYVPLGTLGSTVVGTCALTVAIMSVCIRSDRSMVLYVAAALSWVGILLMMQPEILFKNAGLAEPPVVNWTSPCETHNNGTLSYTEHLSLSETIVGYFLSLGAGMFMAFLVNLHAKMVEVISVFTLGFWKALFVSITSLILMAIFETATFPKSSFCISMLLLHCISAIQLSFVEPYCLKFLSPLVVVVLTNTQMVLQLILQYTVFVNILPGKQNWVEILGGVTCFLASMLGPLSHFVIQHVQSNDKDMRNDTCLITGNQEKRYGHSN